MQMCHGNHGSSLVPSGLCWKISLRICEHSVLLHDGEIMKYFTTGTALLYEHNNQRSHAGNVTDITITKSQWDFLHMVIIAFL